MKGLKDDYAKKCHWNENIKCENNRYCGICEHQPSDDDKPNGKEPPVKAEWRNDYGMIVPYCPKCGEMCYSGERCVFCGQKFIKDEDAPKNKQEYYGIDENGKCKKCGNDTFNLVSHIDGNDYFMYEYKCSECGNHATVKTLLAGDRYGGAQE